MCGMICVLLMCHPLTLFLQALGYFYKFGSIPSLTPPLVMVIMEEWANVIVFLFRRKSRPVGKLCRTSRDTAVHRK